MTECEAAGSFRLEKYKFKQTGDSKMFEVRTGDCGKRATHLLTVGGTEIYLCEKHFQNVVKRLSLKFK